MFVLTDNFTFPAISMSFALFFIFFVLVLVSNVVFIYFPCHYLLTVCKKTFSSSDFRSLAVMKKAAVPADIDNGTDMNTFWNI